MSDAIEIRAGRRTVELKRPEKELFPGITKRDVAEYYLAVAPVMIPHVRDRLARAREGGLDALGLGPERAARLGEHDAPADAGEELDAELRLERAHLLGERRLGEIERAGGAAERAVLGGREEIGELLQCHRRSLWNFKRSQTTPSAPALLP